MAATTTPAVFNVDVNPPVVAPEFKTVVAEQAGEQADGQKQVPYQRAVPLPPVVDEANISAKMTQEGELKLCMPKHAATTNDAKAVDAC
eukprot:jgi/Tetstr1/466639/TSEL_011127.t1